MSIIHKIYKSQINHYTLKKITGVILAASLVITMAGCEATSVPEPNPIPESVSEETTAAENKETVPGIEETTHDTEEVKRQAVEQDENGYPYLSEEVDEEYQNDLFKEGNSYLDYKVERTGTVKALRADTAVLKHETSGATLYLIRNDDKELGFDISYRVPQLNNADIPHIFEHSILAASDKYPATDLFFDMSNTTYNTFTNAITYNTCTSYPFSTLSQGQFIKLLDGYMSCMTSPKVLENENYFKREALRYQLYDIDDPITLSGVVFSEDMGGMTSGQDISCYAVNESLYPDSIMSYANGRCYTDLENLNYSNLHEVYNSYYRFDNSLMILYGDMDYKAVLEYLDREYLSKYPEKEEPVNIPEIVVPDGYVETEYDIPVYEDDTSGSQNSITYAFDLSGFTPEEERELLVFTALMMDSSSVFMKALREEGLQWNTFSTLSPYNAWYPVYQVMVYTQGEDIDKNVIKKIFDDSLLEVSENGFPKEIYDVVIKERELQDAFEREKVTFIDTLSEAIAVPWTRTGDPMVMETDEAAFEKLIQDPDQTRVKGLAKKLMEVDRKALIYCKEKPGLAEKKEQEIEDYLKNLKADMSESELLKLIEDTRDFDEWNEENVTNKNIVINASDLPEPVKYDTPEITNLGECTVAAVPIEQEDIYSVSLFYDPSTLKQEELFDLVLYLNLLGNVSTTERSKEEFDRESNLNGSISTGLSGTDFKEPFDRLYLEVSLGGFTKDFSNNLSLMEEMLTKSDYKMEEVQEIVQILKNNSDPSNISADKAAVTLARALSGTSTGFEYYIMKGMHDYLTGIETALSENDGAIEELAERMKNIRDKIWHSDHMIMGIAASPKGIAEIKSECGKLIDSMPSGTGDDYRESYDYGIPDEKRVGIIVSSPLQSMCGGYILEDSEFKGRYLPFLEALNDRYIIPEMRYRNGAYGADVNYRIEKRVVSIGTSSDPNCKTTLEVLDEAPSALREMSLTGEDIDTYTVSAFNNVIKPMGDISRAESGIYTFFAGNDPDYLIKIAEDMKKATLEDRNGAADVMEKVVGDGYFVMAGNKAKLEEDKDCFDKVFSLSE